MQLGSPSYLLVSGQNLQISGAKVDIYGPKPGSAEGVVVVGGTPDQVRAAQSLIHAFILCGQAF